MVFPGPDMDYDASLDEVLDLPFVGLGEQAKGRFIEQSLPERALSYLQRHISRERLEGMTRSRFWDYPVEVIRELLINAFAHRDWTRQNDTRSVVYRDRMEVTSPGALPNGMTIDKIKAGHADAAQHAHGAHSSRLRADGRSRHGRPAQGDSPDAGAEPDRAGLRGHPGLLQGNAVEGESIDAPVPETRRCRRSAGAGPPGSESRRADAVPEVHMEG